MTKNLDLWVLLGIGVITVIAGILTTIYFNIADWIDEKIDEKRTRENLIYSNNFRIFTEKEKELSDYRYSVLDDLKETEQKKREQLPYSTTEERKILEKEIEELKKEFSEKEKYEKVLIKEYHKEFWDLYKNIDTIENKKYQERIRKSWNGYKERIIRKEKEWD